MSMYPNTDTLGWEFGEVYFSDGSVSRLKDDESAPLLEDGENIVYSSDETAPLLEDVVDSNAPFTTVHCVICGLPATYMCAGCRQDNYCSHECQCYHWKMGHAEKCSQIMSARADLGRLVDTSPLLYDKYGHMTRASIEKELERVPGEDNTLVKNYSTISNLVELNADNLCIDMKQTQVKDGRFYLIANDIVTKCLDELDENVFRPFERARALGIDIDNFITERRHAQEERAELEHERTELASIREILERERTKLAAIRKLLNQQAPIITDETSNTGSE